jgi:hypothetical protein
MAIDFKSRFDELFGQEEVRASAPTLRDVAPGLVDRGGSGFASKELNPRRTAVSARHFRNPRVRSKESAFGRPGAVEENEPIGFGSSFIEGGQTISPLNTQSVLQGGGPGVQGVGADVGPSGDPIGTTVGNAMAQSVGLSGLQSGLGTAALGLATGAPLGAIGTATLGSAVTGALNPLGLLASLAPIAAQGISAHGAAEAAAQSTPGLQGMSQAEAQAAGQQAFAQSPHGLFSAIANVFSSSPSLTAAGEFSDLTGIGDEAAATAQATPGGVTTPSPGQNFGGTFGVAPGGQQGSGGLMGSIGEGLSSVGSTIGTALGELTGNPTGQGPDTGDPVGGFGTSAHGSSAQAATGQGASFGGGSSSGNFGGGGSTGPGPGAPGPGGLGSSLGAQAAGPAAAAEAAGAGAGK